MLGGAALAGWIRARLSGTTTVQEKTQVYGFQRIRRCSRGVLPLQPGVHVASGMLVSGCAGCGEADRSVGPSELSLLRFRRRDARGGVWGEKPERGGQNVRGQWPPICWNTDTRPRGKLSCSGTVRRATLPPNR